MKNGVAVEIVQCIQQLCYEGGKGGLCELLVVGEVGDEGVPGDAVRGGVVSVNPRPLPIPSPSTASLTIPLR